MQDVGCKAEHFEPEPVAVTVIEFLVVTDALTEMVKTASSQTQTEKTTVVGNGNGLGLVRLAPNSVSGGRRALKSLRPITLLCYNIRCCFRLESGPEAHFFFCSGESNEAG